MIVIYFILIIAICAYYCSCDYTEEMGNGFSINSQFWSRWFYQGNCNDNWNPMECPDGYYVSGIGQTHPCGQDGVWQSRWNLKCTKAKGMY